ncbi:hypothetical protein DE146DRAFT_182501 [Phaeosphaeria sp. MPI-PUGE-AT-0046c]|nr:hypothetical protein DE146DRAFT_182501 [Phaeosphaeria sp. MPI-PUGE-AT-0046c]
MPTLIAHAKQAAGNANIQLQRTARNVNKQLKTTTNNMLPPEKREQKINEIRAFSHRNPKLALFLTVQTVVLGLPILLFIAFAVSTLLVSLATCLLIALTTAFIYTAFAVGFALFFLVPTLFTVSFAATCIFLWGLFIYLVLQRFNIGQAPVKRITNFGNSWTLEGTNEHSNDMKKTKVVSKTNGTTGHYSAGNTEHNGSNADTNNHEWEAKWKEGAQQCHDEFAVRLDTNEDVVVGHLAMGLAHD